MGSKAQKESAFGALILGEHIFGEYYETTSNYDAPVDSGYFPRTTLGWGHFGQRVFSRPESRVVPIEPNVFFGGSPAIQIGSSTGAILGTIRTDVQNTIVNSLTFVLDEKGCAEFELILNELPSFPILPFSTIQVTIADTAFAWYKGIVNYYDDAGTSNKTFVYKGFGLRKQLDTLKPNSATIASAQDVGAIVNSLVSTYVVDQTQIEYLSSKINTSTGVITASALKLGKNSLSKLFDSLALMANCRWGVDGDGEFYFELIDSDTINRVFHVGYGVEKFEPKQNIDAVRNAIFVDRNKDTGSGASGWDNVSLANDTTSIKKYGKREMRFQVPGFFGTGECNLIADSLLESSSEPEFTAKSDGHVIQDEDDYFDRGMYRFIMPPQSYQKIWTECDDTSGWTVYGTGGDLALSLETGDGLFATGAGSIKLAYTAAFNSRVEFTANIKGFIQKIRVWTRATKTGTLVEMGIGAFAWSEHQKDITYHTSARFFLFEWDISDLNLKELNYIGFRILDNAGTSCNIHIDEISILTGGHKTYDMRVTKTAYSFTSRGSTASCEWGPYPPKMENYIGQLIGQAQESKFNSEVR